MREIKFRGKRIDNGEWVYGDRWHDAYHKQTFIIPENVMMPIEEEDAVEVRPETVGQSTGLIDKNGKEIYEGDIVRFTSSYSFIDSDIIYHEWGFETGNRDAQGLPYYLTHRDYTVEVIGNVHDNPEMTK